MERTMKKINEKGTMLLELSIGFFISSLVIASTMSFGVIQTVADKSYNILAALLSDLEDMNIENPTAGDVLVWDGTSWVNSRLNLSQIGNTNLSNVQTGDVLRFDGSQWVNSPMSAPALNELDGVNVTNLQKGDMLAFNGSEWVEGNPGKVGQVKFWAPSNAPDGWLVADGRAVSRTSYAELFAAIGTTYGSGDGTTTFNLPDFRGKVAVGRDAGVGANPNFDTVGETGGTKTETLTEAQMPSHTHTQQPHTHSGTTSDSTTHAHAGSATTSSGDHGHDVTGNSGGSHGHSFGCGCGGNASGANQSGGTYSHPSSSSGRTSGSNTFSHTHTYTLDSAGAHNHTLVISEAAAHAHTVTLNNSTAVNNATGGGQAHNNLQPYVVVNYIIKH
jgi:microcystin-dependent protein